MKSLIKKLLNLLGYEIRRLSPQLDNPAPADEVLPGPWLSGVLQMANRHYRPSILRYHRTSFGDDQRLKYIAYFLDVRDQRVLEIGPLEGHHSVILEKMGVRENIAIESRATNLQKCLRTKEKYHLDHTQFLQFDLEALYKGQQTLPAMGSVDLVFCLGVLYHLPDPGRALAWMRSQASTLFLGTHYVDEKSRKPGLYSYRGKSYRVQEWAEGGIDDPISGMSPVSTVLYEQDLLRLIRDAGYSRISVLGRDWQNKVHHITLLAEA